MLRDQLRAIVADWISEGLRLKDWGPVELAEKSGLSREQIWRLREREADATDDTLTALARALKLPLPTLTVRDEQGRGDYRMGVRDALRAVRAKIKEVEVRPPAADGDDDGPGQARRQAKLPQPPKDDGHRRSG